MLDLAWLIPIFPLLGFIINGIIGKNLPKVVSGGIASIAILASFGIVLSIFLGTLSGDITSTTINFFDFIKVGELDIPFSFLIDPLSVLMMMIITGVGFFIHIYSIGYMHHDESLYRYFAYLNLFVFFMLLLVLGSNFVILFIGWEGVGLCSYLLIGFWFKNNDFNDAAKKAFIINRIGDLGFLIAIFLIFYSFGSIQFAEVFPKISAEASGGAMLAIALLLFLGATGKSAQIPLFTWLPDAMAGPTPVSALIHAATMVTAGIYMIARSHVVFLAAPASLDIILIVATITMLLAATIAITQNDIKKVLAYSTVSQLGYMFIALGVGSFTGALFHVMTHAFFKALLFLGSGSVIHAMSDEQDIRQMGGLKKQMPITWITFLIGTIAISGLPPFAGFFSKDLILASAFGHNIIFWVLGAVGAGFTSFYMFRLYFLTFHGEFRGTDAQKSHLHESPLSMTIPLMVLAVLSVVGGFFNLPSIFGGSNALEHFLAPVFADMPHVEHHLDHSTEYLLMGISVTIALVSFFIAMYKYLSKKQVPDTDNNISGLHKVLYNKYYIDELYETLIMKPIDKLSVFGYQIIELKIIDQIVNGTGDLVKVASTYTRKLQTGFIGFYIFAMVIGIAIIVALNFILS